MPRIDGLPVINVLVLVFPTGDEENPETSNQPNFIAPPANPGCVTTTRPPTWQRIGGVQSPVVAGAVGPFALVIPPTARNRLGPRCYAKGASLAAFRAPATLPHALSPAAT